jgi:hypothetical protein
MADVDLDLSGVASLQEEINDLRDEYGQDPIYAVGTNVEYGVFLERGTEDMPAYPWFKPAIREFRRDPEGFIQDTTGFGGIDEIQTTKQMVDAVATGLANRMTDNVNAQDASADRSPGTDPEHPKRDTGNLTASIQAVRIN